MLLLLALRQRSALSLKLPPGTNMLERYRQNCENSRQVHVLPPYTGEVTDNAMLTLLSKSSMVPWWCDIYARE